jgi:hypothetical protein
MKPEKPQIPEMDAVVHAYSDAKRTRLGTHRQRSQNPWQLTARGETSWT